MQKLIYRGVAFDADQKKTEERIFRRPQLVYRGVEHNGVRITGQTSNSSGASKLIYRGFRFA